MAVNVAGAVMITACSHLVPWTVASVRSHLVWVSPKPEPRPTERDLYQGIIDARLELRQRTADSFAMIDHSLISIVDDDESVRESLEGLLKSVGFRVEAFALATDFLNSTALHATNCLIL